MRIFFQTSIYHLIEKWKLFFLTLIIAWTYASTSAQFNLNFESARSLKKNAFEIGGSYASISESYEGDRDKLFNSIGFRIGGGISDNIDIKLNYSRLFF